MGAGVSCACPMCDPRDPEVFAPGDMVRFDVNAPQGWVRTFLGATHMVHTVTTADGRIVKVMVLP